MAMLGKDRKIAKKYSPQFMRDQPSPAVTVDPLKDPKWIEQNRDRMLEALGIDKVVTAEDLKEEARIRKEVEEAAAALGVDLEQKERGAENNPSAESREKLIEDMAKYIDLLRISTDWASIFTPKEKAMFDGIRAFCAQLGVPNLPGHPQTVKDMLSTVKVLGPTAQVVRKPKRIRLTNEHLREAGISV